MDEKQTAKADSSHQPPDGDQKRQLRPTTTAQASTSIPAKADQRRTKNVRQNGTSEATREWMDREGYMKKDETVTVKSVNTAFKLIYAKHNSIFSKDTQKALLAFAAVLGLLAAGKEAKQEVNAETLLQELSSGEGNGKAK
jgi:hypothetical protein